MFVKFENLANWEEILNTSEIVRAKRQSQSGVANRDIEIVEVQLRGENSWSSLRLAEWRKLLPHLNVVTITEANGEEYWLSIDAIRTMARWRQPSSWEVVLINGERIKVPDCATALILHKLKTAGLDDVTKSPAAA